MVSQIYNYLKEQNAKFIFLALLLATLPSLEAPKNLFVLLFLISWIVIALQNQDWGGRWQSIDTIFLFWILADIAVGINAVLIHDQPANGSKDIIKFLLVGWAISRSRFTVKQMSYLCLVAIFFTLFPLIYSYHDCSGGSCIELNSVGHVNHTAIYLLIIYTITISLLVFNLENIVKNFHIELFLISLVLSYVIIDTQSRAASGMWVVITLSAIGYAIHIYRNWVSLLRTVIIILMASTIIVYNPPAVVQKFLNGANLIGESPRQKIRNFAYYVFKIDPVLGTGMGNFPNFDHDDIKELVIKDKGKYNKKEFLPYKHPHNVYLAYLSGGGLILFSIFVLFWLKVTSITYQSRSWVNQKWITFGGAGVILTVLGTGWVNTTLAHEHALITMFFIGLLISRYREVS